MTMQGAELFSDLLKANEQIVGEPTPLSGDSYLVNILDDAGNYDKSVFLVLPNKGDKVGTVRVEADAKFRVRAVRGSGRIVLQRNSESSFSSYPLFSANGHEGVTFTIRKGDKYGYHSIGEEPLIIRDDSDIPFLAEYESDADDSSVGSFNLAAAERQLS